MRLRLDLGDSCNNNCIICSSAYDNTGINPKSIISQIREFDVEQVDIVGREPTLSKDFFYIVSSLKGKCRTKLTTNARRFSYMPFCKRIVELDVNDVNVSVHGIEKTHDTITRTPGSFNQTIKGIKNLLSLGVNVYTNTVVCFLNAGCLPDIADLLFGLGVKRMRIIYVNPKGNAKGRGYLLPRFSEIDFRGLETYAKDIVLLDFPFCAVPNKLHANINVKQDYLAVSNGKFEMIKSERVKSQKCFTCKKNAECEGIFEEYFAKFGEEDLKPI